MIGGEGERDDQSAIKALAEVRRLIVTYRRRVDDWRIEHAQAAPIVDVVAGLIADAETIDALYWKHDGRERKLQERIVKLEYDLAESKRPFTAQMDMQNRRIIALTAELDRLTILGAGAKS